LIRAKQYETTYRREREPNHQAHDGGGLPPEKNQANEFRGSYKGATTTIASCQGKRTKALKTRTTVSWQTIEERRDQDGVGLEEKKRKKKKKKKKNRIATTVNAFGIRDFRLRKKPLEEPMLKWGTEQRTMEGKWNT